MKPSAGPIPVGKLPWHLLNRFIQNAPLNDERIIVGPGIGLDCAVIEIGDRLLVFKSDPITFTSDELGWYLVQVTVNDVATTGAIPRWLLVTFLLPEKLTTKSDVEKLFAQLYGACAQYEIDVIGGHTEITHGLSRPLAIGTLVGEINQSEMLVTPKAAKVGDRLLLTKELAIEATAILAHEFPNKLKGILSSSELSRAQNYVHEPGINVLLEARTAVSSGKISAMHDPTEGGITTALWELAQACNHSLVVFHDQLPISELTKKICDYFEVSPLEAISSGALLIVVDAEGCGDVKLAIRKLGIACTEIGYVESGPAGVSWLIDDRRVASVYPKRDAISKVFEAD